MNRAPAKSIRHSFPVGQVTGEETTNTFQFKHLQQPKKQPAEHL